jgi:MYXO-CTERM domain-containing protein
VSDRPSTREVCDCKDNNCDGDVDEAPATGTLCPSGAECVDCQCALPCQPNEFSQCPTGRAEMEIGGKCFCVAELCHEADCIKQKITKDGKTLCAPNSSTLPSCTCVQNACSSPCDGVKCAKGTVCYGEDARCVEDNCRGLGCPSGEYCDVKALQCTADKCVTMDCQGEVCRDGACERSCATVLCASDESCHQGKCAKNVCAGVQCAAEETCNPADGKCVQDQCLATGCPGGEVCAPVTGNCVADPCTTVHCPDGQSCRKGECGLPVGTKVDGGVVSDGGTVVSPPPVDKSDPEKRILATGGGGCACSLGAPHGASGQLGRAWPALLALCVLGWRRRRRS